MTALHPSETAQALYRSILHAPECDTARLAWADCLEENAGTVECTRCKGERQIIIDVSPRGGPFPGPEKHYVFEPPSKYTMDCPTCSGSGRVSDGLAERAEFVRVQVELARLPDGHCEAELESKRCDQLLGYHTDHWCNSCRLRSRASALLRAHEASWRRGAKCERCHPTMAYTAGHVSADGRFVHVGQCPACHGNGWMGALAEYADSYRRGYGGSWTHEEVIWHYPADWSRGLIYRVYAPLADIISPDGVVTPWALRVRGGDETDPGWPVTEWVATDREPGKMELANKWGWWNRRSYSCREPDDLPDYLWTCLSGRPGNLNEWEWFDSPDAARTALARALGELVTREWEKTQTPAAPDERG